MDRFTKVIVALTKPEEEGMNYYFVVDTTTDIVHSVVQRNKAPAIIDGKQFVKATGVQMTFFLRLSESQGEVTLEQLMQY